MFSLVFSCLKYFVCFYVILVAVTFGSLYTDDIPHQELLGEINALRGGVRSSSVIMVFFVTICLRLRGISFEKCRAAAAAWNIDK